MLSDRIRPNSEAAPWVIEEVKKLESALKNIITASHRTRGDNGTFARADNIVIDMREIAQEALKL